MDVGALTPSLGIWREGKVNEFYERVSVHVCIARSFDQEVWHTIPKGLLKDIMIFYYIYKKAIWIEELLNNNRIFKERFKYRKVSYK
jgi:hypothetical protein